MTSRDVRRGEELTVDYNTLDDNHFDEHTFDEHTLDDELEDLGQAPRS